MEAAFLLSTVFTAGTKHESAGKTQQPVTVSTQGPADCREIHTSHKLRIRCSVELPERGTNNVLQTGQAGNGCTDAHHIQAHGTQSLPLRGSLWHEL